MISSLNKVTPTENKDTKLNSHLKAVDDVKSILGDVIEAVENPSKELLKNVFIPNWDNEPADVPAILTLGGTPILTYQNTSGIIASPGTGKSSISEAIGACFLNPRADALGFNVGEDCKGILIIDNEQTDKDVWKSFSRMCRRAGVSQGSKIGNVKIAGLRRIPRLAERKQIIEQLIKESKCSLVIIDGAGDLVTDTNDLLEAIECRIWIRELTVKYEISILTTLHPNPGSRKPRGHIGSEIWRECECVLLAEKDTSEVRILTSDFEYGKNRSNAHITTAYRWCDDESMFVTTDATLIAGKTKARTDTDKGKIELLALKTLPPPTALTHTALIKKIEDEEECKESTAKRRIIKMEEYGFIQKHGDGLYRYKTAS